MLTQTRVLSLRFKTYTDASVRCATNATTAPDGTVIFLTLRHTQFD